MAPGNIDRESETRNSNANYNRDKPRKPFLRMPTQMQNKIENAGSGAAAGPEDDFSLDLLDEAQMARLKRAFCIFDKDDSGKISHQEMMGVLRLLGTNPTNGELEDIIRGIDLNQDGFIDFLEFARVWWVREQQNIEADFDIELELAFKVFDTDGSGVITRDELRDKLTTLGEKLSEEEVEELLAEADTDNSGTISFEEFKALPFWR
jgi:Ca2+-binding EF-hand superfamily protein